MNSQSVDRSGNTETRPSVGIVVLNWESYNDTVECLESLRKVEYPDFRVVVVDNGSTDGSGERLAQEYAWCDFVFNEENVGFAAGNNPGIDFALSAGVDYVLLLNEDTVVHEDFLTPLVETIERYDDAAAVGGVQHYFATDGIYYAGGRFFPSLGGRVSARTEVKRPKPYAVDFVPTSMILIDAEFVENNDVLHEGYFIGMDDIDLAIQARRDGKTVMIDPRSRIEHKIGMTSGRNPFVMYHWMRNRLHLAEERLAGFQRVLFYVGFVLTIVQFSIVWLYKGRTDLIRAAALGIYDRISDNDFRPYEVF